MLTLLRSLEMKNDYVSSNLRLALLKTLCRLAPFSKEAIPVVLGQLPLWNGKWNWFTYLAAVEAVERLGPAAKAGLPALMIPVNQERSRPDLQEEEIKALVSIGVDAIPSC